jgi:hypothetical protein
LCGGVPTYEEVFREEQDPLMWLILNRDNAIETLHRYKELKGENPQGVSALITLPTSLSRIARIRFMLKGMQVAQQLHRGQVWEEDGQKFVPWSIIQFYDKPKARKSLASILMNQGLEMQLQGRLAGKDLRILVDTGATHSFITKECRTAHLKWPQEQQD